MMVCVRSGWLFHFGSLAGRGQGAGLRTSKRRFLTSVARLGFYSCKLVSYVDCTSKLSTWGRQAHLYGQIVATSG